MYNRIKECCCKVYLQLCRAIFGYYGPDLLSRSCSRRRVAYKSLALRRVVFVEWVISCSQLCKGIMHQTSVSTLQPILSVPSVLWQPIRYELSWLKSAALAVLHITFGKFDFGSFLDGTGDEPRAEGRGGGAEWGSATGKEDRRTILGLVIVNESVFTGFGSEDLVGSAVLDAKLGKLRLVDPKWSIVIIGISDLERRRRDLTL